MVPQWIESSGGPLIAVPRSLCPLWEGSDQPTGGRVVDATFRWDNPEAPATDYDRACDIDDYLGVLRVGPGWGLVLGDEPASTCYVPEPGGGVLVRWICGESTVGVESRLAEVSMCVYQRDTCQFHLEAPPLLVFDSAASGREIDSFLAIDLAPGLYEMSTCVWEPDEQTSLLLHRLALCGDAAQP